MNSGKIRKVCIIGGGNVGVASAVDISQNINIQVSLLTTKAAGLPKIFYKFDIDDNQTTESKRLVITDDYDTALIDADVVIITLPSFLISNTIKIISEYSPSMIIFFPGYGGKELCCKELSSKGCVIAGVDRSPYIARMYTLDTVHSSKKKQLRIAALNKKDTALAEEVLEMLLGISCEKLPNYLTVAFTPSNPILHTSRLCSMFADSTLQTPFQNQIKFYAEWTDSSSELMINMDNELHEMCKRFDFIDLSRVIPLTVHYESNTVAKMTNKL